MNRRGLSIILIIALVIVIAYVAGAWYFSSILIASDTESLAQAAVEGDNPADFGLPQPEAITIDAGDVTLSGWFFDNPADGQCGLLFLHGYQGTRYHVLD